MSLAIGQEPEVELVWEPDLLLYGTVYDFDSRAKLNDCEVMVYIDDEVKHQVTTLNDGRFVFYLPLDEEYKIVFSHARFISKHLIVDTRYIPAESKSGGFEMADLDVSLYDKKYKADMNDDITLPIGKARYFADRGSLEWDHTYTESLKQKLDNKVDSQKLPNLGK